jgi:hypothetical protein
MEKTFYISKAQKSGELNFLFDKEKVSEVIFNDLLSAKLKELLGNQLDQYDKCLTDVTEALESKKPVTIIDRCFEINFRKSKSLN